jgi:hypothetical protein
MLVLHGRRWRGLRGAWLLQMRVRCGLLLLRELLAGLLARIGAVGGSLRARNLGSRRR